MNRHKPCGSCARFPKEALENGGMGTCEGFDRPAAWDDTHCPLYNRAHDATARWTLIKRLMTQPQEENDGQAKT